MSSPAPQVEVPQYFIINADVIEGLKSLPEGSVHCVVTSPPYFGLRDYKIEGQIGLEETPDAYVAKMIEVFREVRRVLRDDGTCWINLGDTYASSWACARRNVAGEGSLEDGTRAGGKRPNRLSGDLKEKDLMGVPWLVAFALRADGWWLRSDCIWAKGESYNPDRSGSVMPEKLNGWRWEQHKIKDPGFGRKDYEGKWAGEDPNSSGARLLMNTRQAREAGVHHEDGAKGGAGRIDCPGCEKCEANDGLILRKSSWRPTRGHEYLFMLTKSGRYYCDAEAVKETGVHPKGTKAAKGSGKREGNRRDESYAVYSGTRNPRSVWTINTKPFKSAHFATFPPKLIEPMIQTTPGEVCERCGAGWAPVIGGKVPAEGIVAGNKRRVFRSERDGVEGHLGAGVPHSPSRTLTHGSRPTCSCNAPSSPSIVLDPFMGSGTVGVVCKAMGRRFLGIELNPEYVQMARERIDSAPEPDKGTVHSTYVPPPQSEA